MQWKNHSFLEKVWHGEDSLDTWLSDILWYDIIGICHPRVIMWGSQAGIWTEGNTVAAFHFKVSQPKKLLDCFCVFPKISKVYRFCLTLFPLCQDLMCLLFDGKCISATSNFSLYSPPIITCTSKLLLYFHLYYLPAVFFCIFFCFPLPAWLALAVAWLMSQGVHGMGWWCWCFLFIFTPNHSLVFWIFVLTKKKPFVWLFAVGKNCIGVVNCGK